MKSPDQELTEVLWARCVGPEGSIDGLEDGQGRRLQALSDSEVGVLEDSAEISQIVRERSTMCHPLG